MITQANHNLVAAYRASSRLASAIVAAIGCAVLVGWMLDLAVLKSVLPGLATMKANTALGFILSGLSLWLLQTESTAPRTRRIAQACAVIVSLLGLLTLGEYIFGWHLGIDQLLFIDRTATADTTLPGRMAPVTALNFILVGLALLVLDTRTSRGLCPAQYLVLPPTLLSLLALAGFAYNAESLYNLAPYSTMSLHAAAAFLLLCAAVLLARPERGLMIIFASNSIGGSIVRRLLPAAILVPVVLGWLRLQGERFGWYDTETGLALFALSNITIFTILVLWTASLLDKSDSSRRQAEQELQRVNRTLQALSNANQALVRTTNESDLLNNICRIIVEDGDYLLAWVGFAENDENKTVRPAARAGRGGDYLDVVSISWADNERGRGPTGAAIRTAQLVVARDIAHDPKFAPWRAEAVQRGYASSIALPLNVGGRAIGALSIYSPRPDVFGAEEVKLLTELAGDLAFGIDSIRTRKAHEQAERRILKEKEFSESLIASLPGIFYLLDEAGKFLQWNRNFETVTGYSADEMAHLTPLDFFAGDDKHFIAQRIRNVFVNGQADAEANFVAKSGRKMPYYFTGRRIVIENQPCLIGVGVDTTELKRAQAELAAKNEELNTMTQQLWHTAKLATMGELAASIAHELNNPLSIVSLRLESLLAQSPADDPRRRALEIAAQECDRMGALVANLLQSSRRGALQISSVDVREEIGNTLELTQYHLRNRNIGIRRETAADVPMVRADRQQLRQLFLNLFANAADAMPQGGTLTIRVSAADNRVFIEISDTGAGITPENLSRVTKPFFTTKSEGKGTGLGLAICRRIVQDHQGTLDITSEGVAGRGTTVRIALPVANGANAEDFKA